MSSDEFDEFDFSKFTPEELELIDNSVACMASSAGPAIDIVLESSVHTEPLTSQQDNTSLNPSKSHLLQPTVVVGDSPYSRFCSWKKAFAVTELVSPIWCEFQYEYGLWGQKNKPFFLRPLSFTARSGKVIRVQHDRAATSNRRLTRGKSTHAALEKELHPEKVTVTPNTPEERFGLRLVQLIAGFNEIIARGKTREWPMFGIIHGHAVIGIIDEIVKVGTGSDTGEQTPDVNGHMALHSGSPVRKKQRTKSPSPGRAHPVSDPLVSVSNDDSTNPTDIPQSSDVSVQDAYALQLIDYKTRRSNSIPPEEDSLSPKLQLMLYHRMLTSLLAPETIDFKTFWHLMDLDPTRSFSRTFIRDVWMGDSTSVEDVQMDLDSLVSQWVSIVHEEKVEMGRLQGVNVELQLIYRRPLDPDQPLGKQRRDEKGVPEINDPLDALALQGEQEIANVVAEKLRQIGTDGKDAITIARAVVEKIRIPYSPELSPSVWSQAIGSGSEREDIGLEWAIQESLLSCAEHARVASSRSCTPTKITTKGNTPKNVSRLTDTAQDVSEMSPIIGERRFLMDDGQLDSYLQDILQWWLGRRGARGVLIPHSYRCFTCEYQDSCEWREEKAKEATAAAQKRKLTEKSNAL
ncbi:exonuclease V [Scleroderma yunnanense]